jgi:hypothetical protein
MLPELSAQLPAIISEAAKSPLGIFALMIISLALLGFFFFKEATEKTRIAIFVMLFVGVAVFGLSIVRTTSAAEPASGAPAAAADADALIKSILGTWTGDVIYVPPRSFRETFTFEMVGNQFVITPTFLGSERTALNVKIGNGTVQFDVKRQEIAGEVATDIVSSYIGEVYPDRIDFVLRHDNGDPMVRFRARRADSK